MILRFFNSKKYLFVVAMICVFAQSNIAIAQGDISLLSGDVVVPTVSSVSDVTQKEVGMIVYDLSGTGGFKGYSMTGGWKQFSSSNVISPSPGTEVVTRAILSRSTAMGNNCDATGCVVASQSGSWITSLGRATNGVYNLTIASGTFSATPSCTCSAIDLTSFARSCTVTTGTATSKTVYVTYFSNTSGVTATTDAEVQVICVGPQ